MKGALSSQQLEAAYNVCPDAHHAEILAAAKRGAAVVLNEKGGDVARYSKEDFERLIGSILKSAFAEAKMLYARSYKQFLDELDEIPWLDPAYKAKDNEDVHDVPPSSAS